MSALAAVERGPVWRRGLTLTAQNVVVLTAPVATVALAGQMSGEDLYLRSLYQPVAFVLIGLVVGFSVTMQVRTSRGEGDVRTDFLVLARMSVIVSVVLLVLIQVFLPWTVGVLRIAPGEAEAFRFFVGGMIATLPALIAGELASAALRASNGMAASLVLSCGQVVVTLGITGGVGIGSGAGITAVPFADFAGGACECAAGLLLLRRRGVLGPRRPARVAVLRSLLRIGLPAGASSLLVAAVSLILMTVAAPFGPAAVSALASGLVLESLVLALAFGYGAAMGVMVNRALATGEKALALYIFRAGMVQVAAGYALYGVVIAVGAETVGHVLAASEDTAHLTTGLLIVLGPAFGATGVVVTVFTLLQYLGRGTLTLVLNLVYFAAVLPICAMAAAHGDFADLYHTLAIASAVSLITGVPPACLIVIKTVRRAAVGVTA